jgi:hypothetical protein
MRERAAVTPEPALGVLAFATSRAENVCGASSPDRFAPLARRVFVVKAVVCYGKRRFAPVIVIESDQYVQLSRAIMGITGHARGAGNRFPILAEAVDSRGIPYSILMSWVTASAGTVHPWARADALWPCARCHTV